MKKDENGMTDVLTIGATLFAQTGKDIVVPRINGLLNKLERQYKVKVLPKKRHLEDYWLTAYKKMSTVNSVIFGNSQRQLREIYVPVSLLVEGDDVKVAINDYPKELIDSYQRILIKDSLGMGKSTIVKIMFLDVIDNEIGYPIFVELRHLSKERTLIQEILNQLGSINNTFDEQLLLDLISTGGFIFFLDGLDEVKLDERRFIVDDVQNFVSKANKCQFVITSREDDALAGFGNFKGCSIVVMNPGDICSLLLRYGNKSKKVEELVGKISRHEYQDIDDFLKSPLLVGLLFRAYMEKEDLDLKLYQLCSNIFPVFFEQHDQTKDGSFTHDKLSQLDAFDMERVLRVMGFYCVAKNKINYSYDDFNQLINYAVEQCGNLNVKIDGLRDDFSKSVPLFCKDGCYYRWVHSSLCYYYAARYIYLDGKKKLPDILHNMCFSKNARNYERVIKMYAEMDRDGFNLYVVKPLLEQYVAAQKKGRSAMLNPEDMDDNTAMLLGLLFELIPSLFNENGILDVEKSARFYSEIEKNCAGDNIEDLIKGL
jgi:hypothetical protein